MRNQKTESSVILIVEDDTMLSKMYEEKFSSEGFTVLTAIDGEQGLRSILENKIDFILLDLLLPRVSGLEMLAHLRKDEAGRDIPVIALTNVAEPTERNRALNLGAKDYLVKAMQTPEEVVEKVIRYLSD